jgi:hypothetical protein
MNCNAGRLEQSALLKGYVLRKGIAKVGWRKKVTSQGAIVRRRCGKSHSWAKIISTILASSTSTTWDTRLNGNLIARLEVFDQRAYRVDCARRFMAKNHWFP